MATSAIVSESPTKKDVLMAFPPESEASSIRAGPLPMIDPLLEFSCEEDRTPVAADRRHESTSRASGAWRVLASEVARDVTRSVTWLSTRQAALKVGLYEMVVGLSGMADSFAGAVRVRGHSMNRRLRLGPSFARATLNAIVMRGSAFTSQCTPHTRRALIPFVYGVAVGVVVTLFLAQSIPRATMPEPGPALSQAASGGPGSVVPSVRPPANTRSVGAGVQQTVTTAGRRESDQTSAESSSQAQSPSARNAASGQGAASPKAARYSGSLAVDSAPKGARVLINGVPVGTTPLLLKDVPVGSRVVRLELDGYERWSSAVRVVANQRVLTSVDLQSSPSSN